MPQSSDTVIVDAPAGRFAGRTVETDSAPGISVFRGIRFAEPPVGELRFAPPVPVKAPSDTGAVIEAFEWGHAALQPPSMLAPIAEPASEDCLFLNVWSPAAKAAGSAEPLPVMVWFHGGGFTGGSGAIRWYDGAALARRGAVVVTVNYRLGVFGFLHVAGLEGARGRFDGSGVAGILDQTCALEWVSDNIAAFGGDPSNVTIFGESAGAMSVGIHLALPASAGLFRRAICQSGAASAVVDAATGTSIAETVCAAVGVSPSDPDALRAVPADKLLEAQATLGPNHRNEIGLPVMPVIEGTFLPQHPERLLTDSPAPIDLLIGTNADEMKLFNAFLMAGGEPDEDKLRRRIAHQSPAPVDEIIATYRRRLGADASIAAVVDAFESDRVFRIPAMRLAELQSAGDHAVFDYLFAEPSTAFGGILGAAHAVEIPYVFDNLDQPGVEMLLGSSTPERTALATAMADAWVRFAATGDPRGDGFPNVDRYTSDCRSTAWLEASHCRVEIDLWPEERAIHQPVATTSGTPA